MNVNVQNELMTKGAVAVAPEQSMALHMESDEYVRERVPLSCENVETEPFSHLDVVCVLMYLPFSP